MKTLHNKDQHVIDSVGNIVSIGDWVVPITQTRNWSFTRNEVFGFTSKGGVLFKNTSNQSGFSTWNKQFIKTCKPEENG